MQKEVEEIRDLQKKIRILEIELEHIESTDPYNYKYTRVLESKIDKLYEEVEELDENN